MRDTSVVFLGHVVRMRRRAATRVFLAVALGSVALTACGGGGAPRHGVTAQQLTGSVSGSINMDTARVGSRISLRGTVVRVLPPKAFELSPADGATKRPVLVLGNDEGLHPGQVVQVGGHVNVLLDDAQSAEAGAATPAQLPDQYHKRIIEADVVDTDVPADSR